MVLDPQGISVVEWTDRVNPYLGRYGTIPFLKDPELWRDWVSAVILLPGVSTFTPPDPNSFQDWRDWANAFNIAVPSYL